MKTNCAFLSVLFCLLFTQINAQIIPDSLRVDWSQAGYQGVSPDPSLIINVQDFGAYADGIHNDYNAINSAIKSSNKNRVIFFPAGNYLINSSIKIPNNVVLRGEGEVTNLIFDLEKSNQKDAIVISIKQKNSFTPIISGYNKGSSVLNLENTSAFNVDDYLEIRQANGSWDTRPVDWATYCVGQIVKIIAVNATSITIEPGLRINYTASLNPEVRTIIPARNIGIECLKITRADTILNGKYGNNLNFSYAVNCWLTGVESNKSQGAHISMVSCKSITVSGCYFHDAFTYDGKGTAGYGINMIQHASDCKVENCIFKHLRHAMIAKQGSNGNVYAYNYSLDEHRSEFPNDGGADMLLHGDFGFANLFEGNICQTIMIDNTWGPSGPCNTFFRNRAELYGLIISSNSYPSDYQNIVGNEVTNTGFLKGNYSLSGKQFTYDNNINGILQPETDNNFDDQSYYLIAQPYFWNITDKWPSIGGSNTLNSGSNPAKKRYFSNESKTICLYEQPAKNLETNISADSITCNGGISDITVTATGGLQPYKGTGTYSEPAGDYTFTVTDASGNTNTTEINLGQPDLLIASAQKTNTSCKNVSNGTITIKGTGGTKPYSYSIDSVNYTSDNFFSNLNSGTYTYWVRDKKGCISSSTSLVKKSKINCSDFSDAIDASSQSDIELKTFISPNPSTQRFELSIQTNSKQKIVFFVTDVYGRIIYSATGSAEKSYQFGEQFSPGVYMLKCIQGNVSKTYKIVKQ
ncbi:MAG: glycosyl hydrolase family 28-related protein [Parafilimonas sp.]